MLINKITTFNNSNMLLKQNKIFSYFNNGWVEKMNHSSYIIVVSFLSSSGKSNKSLEYIS